MNERRSTRRADRSTTGISLLRPFGFNRARSFSILLLLSIGRLAWAADAYTDQSSFSAAAPGGLSTLNFDSVAAGTLIPDGGSLAGISFGYSIGSEQLKVTGLYPAPSGTNSLGSTDADILQDGDNLDFSFAPTNAFGLLIITRDPLQAADLNLTADGATAVLNPAAVQTTLSDGANVYFLGVVSSSTFSSASLTTVGGGFFFYNIDDLQTSTGADSDGDGIPDGSDNCIEVANPAQRDTDVDGYGNYCDADLDNSGFVNFADLAAFKAAFGTADADSDFNGSGFVNFADLAIFKSLFGKAPGPSGVAP